MTEKIPWKDFFIKSSYFTIHILLIVLYCRISIVLINYYHAYFFASITLALCFSLLCFLLIFLFDHWASILYTLNEKKIAENLYLKSIWLHNKIFPGNNTILSAKQAMLAELYLTQNEKEKSLEEYAKSLNTYKNSSIKYPGLSLKFQNLINYILNHNLNLFQENNSTAVNELLKEKKFIEAEIRKTDQKYQLQNILLILLTFPICAYFIYIQHLEQTVAKCNAKNEVIEALKNINKLAQIESFLFGSVGEARVYVDYAEAFNDLNSNQMKEALWCAKKAIDTLSKSKKRDNLLEIKADNIIGKGYLSEGDIEKAETNFQKAAELIDSLKFPDTVNPNFILQKEQSLYALAEINRYHQEYKKAEKFYFKIFVLDQKKPNFSSLNSLSPFVSENLEKLRKLQDIEMRLNQKDRALEIQKVICHVLKQSLRKDSDIKLFALSIQDQIIKETARELENCALMLQDNSQEKLASVYSKEAELIRNKQNKELHLDQKSQKIIVDSATNLTYDLLALKYKSGKWRNIAERLNTSELFLGKGKDLLNKLPWFDKSFKLQMSDNNTSLKKISESSSEKFSRLEVDIRPMSVHSQKEGLGIAVDVSGIVKVYDIDSNSHKETNTKEHNFNFAYLYNDLSKERPRIADMSDNQALYELQVD